ncbi:MAG: hypothetical protein V5A39_11920 [Haloarculaceae archaeon]
MSLSPIERQGESGAGARDGRGRGVREWLARLVSRVADRVRGCLTNAAQKADDSAGTQPDSGHEAAELRPRQRDRATLESGPEVRQLPATASAELPAGPDHWGATEATLEGDSLRIHRPDSREAYIVSDVYERVEP